MSNIVKIQWAGNIRIFLFVALSAGLLSGADSAGQTSMKSFLALPDSVSTFSLQQLYRIVLEHHPIARQSVLLSENAKQELRLARGAFDPKVEISFSEKQYQGVEYFNLLNSRIKFPSFFPIDPVVGVERNRGDYLNPEHYLSNEFQNQQVYTGLSLPLGRGLITDDRRAAIQQAKLFGQMMEAERVKLINKLLLDVAKDYWQWSFYYYNYRLYNQSVSIASEVFRRVKLNGEQGEAAPVDTVQAKITLQQRLVERQEAILGFQNAGIQLSNHLWDSLGNPLQLSDKFAPELRTDLLGITTEELNSLLTQAQVQHPELRKLNVKLGQLDVERKLAAEYLKPKLNLNYYMLNQPFDPAWNPSLNLTRDYKFGLDFSFPVLIRKERSKLEQTKIKINNTQLEQVLTRRQIENQINSSYNELINNGIIIAQQSDMMQNYERLLAAELLNLENGESDLFKINIQQEKLIQSQSKLLKLLSEYEKQKAFLYWAAGIMQAIN
ncbi:MAG TPA: TolC family protein [Cyclobacteriaceae bacterium]|nr:TolC family protein [Cyclobacteriaceae bacterium]